MTKLEDLRAGDWVRWGSVDWEVTGRTVYRESADYQEVQWEIEGGYSTRYLVMSTENKGGGTEVIWVCTQQTGIGRVQRPDGGGWRSFREKDSMSAPPPKVRFGDTEYSLEGETQGRAVDDEGDEVNKLTWDYYDPSGKRNLAIEVWQCSDADYYEAYDGLVVKPGEFARIPAPPRRLPRLNKDAVSALVAGLFACVFFLPLFGGVLTAMDVGAEYLAALLLPVLLAGVAYAAGAHPGLLGSACAFGAAAGLALLKLRGLGSPYWEYAAYGLAAGPAAAEIFPRFFGGVRRSDKGFAGAAASLLFMFVVSFAHYISCAPRPHNLGSLSAACVLSLPPAALVLAGYLFLGGSDEPA